MVVKLISEIKEFLMKSLSLACRNLLSCYAFIWPLSCTDIKRNLWCFFSQTPVLSDRAPLLRPHLTLIISSKALSPNAVTLDILIGWEG